MQDAGPGVDGDDRFFTRFLVPAAIFVYIRLAECNAKFS
jgi:hypothetical protein